MLKRIPPPVFWIVLVAVVFALGYRIFASMQPDETALGPGSATTTTGPTAAKTPETRPAGNRPGNVRSPLFRATRAATGPGALHANARSTTVRPSETVASRPPAGVVSSTRWTSATSFTYDGRWEHVTGRFDGRTNGSSSRSFRPGSRAALAFRGRFIRLYGVVGPGGGRGAVDIDGRTMQTVDFYAKTKAVHRLVYSSPPLGTGPHHLTLSVVPDRTAPAGRSRYVNIDGAETNS